MSAVGERVVPRESEEIRDLRKKLRLTQDKMAEALGVESTTYHNWEYKSAPPPEMLDRARLMADSFSAARAKDKVKIPVLGYIGAGGGRPMGDGEREGLYVSAAFGDRGYSASVLGADSVSMHPYLHPGDTAIFKPTALPKVGYIIAARLPDQPESIVKELVFEKGQLALRSFNPEVPDIVVPGMQIVGYLVGFESPDGRVRVGPEDAGITRGYLDSLFRSRLP